MCHKFGTIEPINWCSMLTKKQIKILQPFLANIFKGYGQRELGRLVKENSNNAIQIAIAQFEKEELAEIKGRLEEELASFKSC